MSRTVILLAIGVVQVAAAAGAFRELAKLCHKGLRERYCEAYVRAISRGAAIGSALFFVPASAAVFIFTTWDDIVEEPGFFLILLAGALCCLAIGFLVGSFAGMIIGRLRGLARPPAPPRPPAGHCQENGERNRMNP